MDSMGIHYLGEGIYPSLLKAISEDNYLEGISGLTSS